jgi:hypothetical protein
VVMVPLMARRAEGHAGTGRLADQSVEGSKPGLRHGLGCIPIGESLVTAATQITIVT